MKQSTLADYETLDCPLCERSDLKNRQGLGCHMGKKHGTSLQEHERQQELEENSAECPECGETFKNEYGVKIHYSLSHEGSIAGVEVECTWCGETFREQPAHAEASEKDFCDKWCYAEWRSENFTGEGNPMYGVDGEDAPGYGRTGEDNPMYGRTGLDNPMGGVTGEDHPGWEGGHEPGYGSNWKRQRRKAIERDDETCQICGMTRQEHEDEYGRDISVHHITRKKYFRRWSEADESVELEHANVLRNILTLCIKCNNRVDKYGMDCPVPKSHWRYNHEQSNNESGGSIRNSIG